MQIITVAGQNPGPFTGAGTNTYLLLADATVLVDTGSGVAAHIDELARTLDAAERSLDHVIVTHGHVDHVGGVPAIAKRWPGTRFFKFPAAGDEAHDVAFTPLGDDQILTLGSLRLWIVHTPGHAPDHVVVYEPRSGVLFGGDLVANGGTVVIPARRGGRLDQYLQSLHKVLDLQPRRILPGHGGPIENPPALLKAYIAHRLARERQILDALSGGDVLTTDEIVARVYEPLQPSLREAAGESVLAHLVKLRDDRRVVERGNGWMRDTRDPKNRVL